MQISKICVGAVNSRIYYHANGRRNGKRAHLLRCPSGSVWSILDIWKRVNTYHTSTHAHLNYMRTPGHRVFNTCYTRWVGGCILRSCTQYAVSRIMMIIIIITIIKEKLQIVRLCGRQSAASTKGICVFSSAGRVDSSFFLVGSRCIHTIMWAALRHTHTNTCLHFNTYLLTRWHSYSRTHTHVYTYTRPQKHLTLMIREAAVWHCPYSESHSCFEHPYQIAWCIPRYPIHTIADTARRAVTSTAVCIAVDLCGHLREYASRHRSFFVRPRSCLFARPPRGALDSDRLVCISIVGATPRVYQTNSTSFAQYYNMSNTWFYNFYPQFSRLHIF